MKHLSFLCLAFLLVACGKSQFSENITPVDNTPSIDSTPAVTHKYVFKDSIVKRFSRGGSLPPTFTRTSDTFSCSSVIYIAIDSNKNQLTTRPTPKSTQEKVYDKKGAYTYDAAGFPYCVITFDNKMITSTATFQKQSSGTTIILIGELE